MKKTYHGSCHCGAVKYQADIDLFKGTGRCNCSYCLKTRNWSTMVEAGSFRLPQGEAQLGDYGKTWPGGESHHRFCTRCGVTLYGHGHIPEMGGDYTGVQVNTLDDASIDELVSGPITYMDGLHDNWMNPPDDSRHL